MRRETSCALFRQPSFPASLSVPTTYCLLHACCMPCTCSHQLIHPRETKQQNRQQNDSNSLPLPPPQVEMDEAGWRGSHNIKSHAHCFTYPPYHTFPIHVLLHVHAVGRGKWLGSGKNRERGRELHRQARSGRLPFHLQGVVGWRGGWSFSHHSTALFPVMEAILPLYYASPLLCMLFHVCPSVCISMPQPNPSCLS